jgi:HlyD family secretion protein
MKKWILALAVAGLIAGAWYYIRTNVRYTPIWFQPKFGEVTRGDITVPISAAGLIEPNQRIEVKSKASGEVIELPVDEGRYVRPGTVLLVLKRDDEQRRYDSALAELERAQAMLEQARAAVLKAEANIKSAEADVERLEAECRSSEFDLNKVLELRHKTGDYTEQELVTARARHESNLAALKKARALLEIAKVDAVNARHTVAVQEAAVKIAQTELGNARERLDETTIVAKHEAIVTDVRVKISEVIQGGLNTITGGTPVMYLADVSRKKVIARVDESDYGRVLRITPPSALPEMPGLKEADPPQASPQRDGKVRLTVDAFPEEHFEGVIERVEPQGRQNPGSAVIQYNVHVVITDPRAYKLPLGAQAQVEFTVERAVNALRVPAEAVKTHQGQRGVWVEVPPPRGSNERWGKKFLPCRFGVTDGEHTQVIEVLGDMPLKEGMRVYTKLPVEQQELEEKK